MKVCLDNKASFELHIKVYLSLNYCKVYTFEEHLVTYILIYTQGPAKELNYCLCLIIYFQLDIYEVSY